MARLCARWMRSWVLIRCWPTEPELPLFWGRIPLSEPQLRLGALAFRPLSPPFHRSSLIDSAARTRKPRTQKRFRTNRPLPSLAELRLRDLPMTTGNDHHSVCPRDSARSHGSMIGWECASKYPCSLLTCSGCQTAAPCLPLCQDALSRRPESVPLLKRPWVTRYETPIMRKRRESSQIMKQHSLVSVGLESIGSITTRRETSFHSRSFFPATSGFSRVLLTLRCHSFVMQRRCSYYGANLSAAGLTVRYIPALASRQMLPRE